MKLIVSATASFLCLGLFVACSSNPNARVTVAYDGGKRVDVENAEAYVALMGADTSYLRNPLCGSLPPGVDFPEEDAADGGGLNTGLHEVGLHEVGLHDGGLHDGGAPAPESRPRADGGGGRDGSTSITPGQRPPLWVLSIGGGASDGKPTRENPNVLVHIAASKLSPRRYACENLPCWGYGASVEYKEAVWVSQAPFLGEERRPKVEECWVELQTVNLGPDGQPKSGSGRFYSKQQVLLPNGTHDPFDVTASSEFSVLEGDFSFVSTKLTDNRNHDAGGTYDAGTYDGGH